MFKSYLSFNSSDLSLLVDPILIFKLLSSNYKLVVQVRGPSAGEGVDQPEEPRGPGHQSYVHDCTTGIVQYSVH